MSMDKLFDGSDAHLLPDAGHDDCNICLRKRVKELEDAATFPPHEPTDAMLKAGWEVEELQTPERVWKAMYATWEINMGKRPNV